MHCPRIVSTSKAPLARHVPDCLGQAHGAGGRGVSFCVPELWGRHPADRVQTVLPVRNHPWPSHCWQPPVAADILSAIRGRSGRSSRIWVNRSSRLPSLPPAARPPTGASSRSRTTIGRSFKRRPTSCPRSTSTASERCRTRGIKAPDGRPGRRSAPRREKRHSGGEGHPTNNPTRTLRCQQALHHDGRRHTVGTRRRLGSVLDDSDQSGRNSTRLRMSSGFMRDAIRARSWIAPPMVIRN